VYDVTNDDGQKTVVAVTRTGGTLFVDYGAKGKEPLTALSPARFSWSGTIVEFSTTAAGGVNLLIRYVEGDDRGQRRAP
jgi:hypothetical protein